MCAQATDSQVFVITKDKAFFDIVADQVRQASSQPQILRPIQEIDELPPAVGLHDLVLVDAQTCDGPIAKALGLPCGKIIFNGIKEVSLRDIRLTLAQACTGKRPHRSSRAVGQSVEAVGPAAEQGATRVPPGIPVNRPERTLLSFACRLATLKPEKINEACRECLPPLVGTRRASGYLYVPAKARLELAWHTSQEPIAECVAVSPFRTDSPMAVAVNRRSTWYAEDVDRELTALGIAAPRPHAGHYPSGACIVAPIVYGAELLGVVNFADPVDGGAFDRRELEPLIEGLTHLLAATWQSVGAVGSLEQLARSDGLTGLANYRAFEETIAREVTRARRYGLPLSLIMMDVDHLKQVNDRLGHQAGDLLLREVARRLAGAVRETDIAARQGGDEFSVILPNTALPAAQQVIARVEEALNGARVRWLKQVFESSVSIAFGQYDGHSSASEFVDDVDARLYRRKPCSQSLT